MDDEEIETPTERARRRENTEPNWAMYYEAYRVLTGHEPDGTGLSPHAWRIADAIMKNVIPKFFQPIR